MEKNTLEIKHVADLLNMKFNIPNYQRGYRWEDKHVTALLDDLYSYSVQIDKDNITCKSGKFYCIQPLAVVKNKKLTHEQGNDVYDVIDGQQRLTTLYLLLSYLKEAREALYSGELKSSMFELRYESRESDFFINEEYKNSNIETASNNIDFFYMTRAYKTINDWFEKTGHSKGMILKVIIPDRYKPILESDALAEIESKKRNNDELNDVRFIWYEVPVDGNNESMEVFAQLNYGKTALTSTELVKALLFQRDVYTKDKSLMREIAFRRSCEWDSMEKQLQDPYMWSMFMPLDYICSSHINIVLQLVCNKLYDDLLKKEKDLKIKKDSQDFVYDVCNKILSSDIENYAENVEEIWKMVQCTFTALYNWYKNPDTYHLIGLLVWMKEFKNKEFNYAKRFELLEGLMCEYNLKSKDKFIKYLKEQIANIIHIDEDMTVNGIKIPWGLKYINYHDDTLKIIKILVTFNVEDIRQQQCESARFPFHLLREYSITSLEHIHPQHLELDNIKFDAFKTWLTVKEESLRQISNCGEYSKSIEQIKSLTESEDSYKNNKDEVINLINKIDKEFDKKVEMDDIQMHTLYNMALVDKETNSALSNNLLDRKREILVERQNKKLTYVMPTTQKVFSKYYSPANDENILPKLWTKNDREAYFKKIEEMYNSFNNYYTKK